MKKLIAFLLFILFLILTWFSWQWYKNNILCCDEAPNKVETKEEITPQATVQTEPLVFNWNSDKVIPNDLWQTKKNEILSGFSDGKILKIEGFNFEEEVNSTSFENLGLARADAVRKLLLDTLTSENIEISSKLKEFNEDAKSNPFDGVNFEWVSKNENVQEIEDKTLIYFPYNSTDKVESENINQYLSKVAAVIEGNDKTITLTGHTDNIGNPPFNKKLGMLRALAMKKLLVNSGVDPKRIKVFSEGQSQPIATNDTEEGREKNRRVELEIK